MRGFNISKVSDSKIAIGSIIFSCEMEVCSDIMLQKAGEGLNGLKNFIRSYNEDLIIKSNELASKLTKENMDKENIKWG